MLRVLLFGALACSVSAAGLRAFLDEHWDLKHSWHTKYSSHPSGSSPSPPTSSQSPTPPAPPAPKCPPAGFDSVAGFDVNKYVGAPWYILQQMPLNYQPVGELFCVRARYTFEDPSKPEKGIIVNNYANRGKVNGEPTGTSGSNNGTGIDLRAVPALPGSASPTAASKFLVGPKFLQNILPEPAWRSAYGPYWVVAVDPNYQWAIVSGGAPNNTGPSGKCVALSTGPQQGPQAPQENGGFWLFSRKPVDPEGTKIMRNKAEELGLDLAVLVDVQQEGCKYEGAA